MWDHASAPIHSLFCLCTFPDADLHLPQGLQCSGKRAAQERVALENLEPGHIMREDQLCRITQQFLPQYGAGLVFAAMLPASQAHQRVMITLKLVRGISLIMWLTDGGIWKQGSQDQNWTGTWASLRAMRSLVPCASTGQR